MCIRDSLRVDPQLLTDPPARAGTRRRVLTGVQRHPDRPLPQFLRVLLELARGILAHRAPFRITGPRRSMTTRRGSDRHHPRAGNGCAVLDSRGVTKADLGEKVYLPHRLSPKAPLQTPRGRTGNA